MNKITTKSQISQLEIVLSFKKWDMLFSGGCLTHFFIDVVYITGDESVLSSSQHYDIIISGVILFNLNILRENPP